MKWYQLHLSTLLLLTVLAGIFVWMNVCLTGHAKRGWPFHHTTTLGIVVPNDLPRTTPAVLTTYDVSWDYLAVDVVVCLALLTGFAATIEWLTRRMKRKPTP